MIPFIRATFIGMSFLVLTACQYLPVDGMFQFGPKDQEITQQVEYLLKHDPDLAPFTFHVETADKVVYLSGYVKTIRQSDLAQSRVMRVRGVKAVENNIVVRK